MASRPFWEIKTLRDMTPVEWESLCDGCGLCCLVRLQDEDSDEVMPTRVACRLFDSRRCGCSDYDHRHRRVPECIRLTPGNVSELAWLPPSCAYRRIDEGKPLPRWHPLITGDPESVHAAGVSVRGQTISEDVLDDPDAALGFIAPEWLKDRSED